MIESMRKKGYVYILTNRTNKVLYVGVTSNLIRRVWEHKTKVNKCFTSRYNIIKLVYYETLNSIRGAIRREKQLKNLLRKKKVVLIEKNNPFWKDLYRDIIK